MKGKQLFIILCASLLPWTAWADEEPRLTVSAPGTVACGEEFRVSFALTYYAKEDSLQQFFAPEFSGFQVLAGPSRSTSSSYSMTNGKMTSVFSFAITYVLSARDTGTFIIPSATAATSNDILTSEPVRIHVLPAGSMVQKDSADIFIKTLLSSTSGKVNAPIVLEYQLWATTMIDSIGTAKILVCDPEDFNLEMIDTRNARWEKTNLNGKEYQYATLMKCVLYPLRPGRLEIKSFRVPVFYHGQVLPKSFFDEFFSSYVSRKREVITPQKTIQVEP